MIRKHIAILGGGISGLSLAWFLQKKYGDRILITLIEKEKNLGGMIQTVRQEGFLFEMGPQSCRAQGSTFQATLALIEELQLETEILLAAPEARRRYRWIDGQMQLLPHSLLSFLFSPIFKELLPKLLKEIWIPSSSANDETVHSFITRRLSSEIAERFFDPLATGIYAGDIKALSMKSCFPTLFHYEKEHGSIIKGLLTSKKTRVSTSNSPLGTSLARGKIFSFRQGMISLVRKLTEALSIEVVCCKSVESLIFREKGINIACEDGETLFVDKVFSALPAYALADILKEQDVALAQELKAIRHAPITVVNIGLKQQLLPYKGFGYLIPTSEKQNILGAIWGSSIFPEHQDSISDARVSVMIGGEHMAHLTARDDDSVIDLAIKSLSEHLSVDIKPKAICISKIPRAIPQFIVGYQNKIDRIKKLAETFDNRLHLSGSWISGVSINDCISHSKKLALETRYDT